MSICSSISRLFYTLLSTGGLHLLPCQEKELAKSFVTVITLLQAGIGAVLYEFPSFPPPLRAVLPAHLVGQPLELPCPSPVLGSRVELLWSVFLSPSC